MSEINLDEAKIKFEDQWLSAEELAKKIEEKMKSGEMKFAGLAAALEELNKAMENTHTLNVKIIITKDHFMQRKKCWHYSISPNYDMPVKKFLNALDELAINAGVQLKLRKKYHVNNR